MKNKKIFLFFFLILSIVCYCLSKIYFEIYYYRTVNLFINSIFLKIIIPVGFFSFTCIIAALFLYFTNYNIKPPVRQIFKLVFWIVLLFYIFVTIIYGSYAFVNGAITTIIAILFTLEFCD